MTTEGRYGNWRIYYDPPPISSRAMDWHYYHVDREGVGGHEASMEACKEAIDLWEEDHK